MSFNEKQKAFRMPAAYPINNLQTVFFFLFLKMGSLWKTDISHPWYTWIMNLGVVPQIWSVNFSDIFLLNSNILHNHPACHSSLTSEEKEVPQL